MAEKTTPEIKPGDTVTLVQRDGSGREVGRLVRTVRKGGDAPFPEVYVGEFPGAIFGQDPRRLPAWWRVEKVERPFEPPAEPGLYLDCEGDVWRREKQGFFAEDDALDYKSEHPERVAPFRRLAVVDETRQETLREVIEFLRRERWGIVLSKFRAYFGLTGGDE